MNRFYLGVLLICLSAAGFGLMPIFALYAYEGGTGVTTLLFLRFAIAALFFFSYLLFKSETFRITKRQFFSLFLLGGVLYTMQSSFYFSSLKYIPASLTALLLYMYPIFVAVLAFFFEKEKLSKQVVASIGLSVVGIMIVLGAPAGSVNYLGVVLALCAAITYSVYILMGNRVVAKVPAVVTSSFVAMFAALSFLVLGLATDNLELDVDRTAWLPIAAVALFSTVLSIFTFFNGMRYIGSTRASIISTIEPVITVVFSALLFGERLSWVQALGGVLVLTSAVLVVWAQKEKEGAKSA